MDFNFESIVMSVGAVLATIVLYYVKSMMDDFRRLPELINRVSSLVEKVEKMMVEFAIYQTKLDALERRIEKLETKLEAKHD
jgi:allophanate hydrolase subunit 1